MDLQGVGQTNATYMSRDLPSSQDVSSSQSKDVIEKSHSSEPQIRTIDMRNISPNEYNELVRAGLADLPVPMVLPGGRVHLDGQQELMADVKTDYIAQIEQSIEFSKSIDDKASVLFLQKRLAIVTELHGQEYESSQATKGVDVKA